MRIASQNANTGVEDRDTVKSAVSLFFCGKMGNGNQIEINLFKISKVMDKLLNFKQ